MLQLTEGPSGSRSIFVSLTREQISVLMNQQIEGDSNLLNKRDRRIWVKIKLINY